MIKRKTRLLRQSILVAIGLLGSSLIPAYAATSTPPTKKVYKIRKIDKNLLRQISKASITKVKPVYGMETALIPNKFIKSLKLTENANTILNFVPGVNASSMNAIGTKPHISIRGFSQTQLGFTYDNLPVGDLFYGGFSGGNINYGYLSQLVPVVLGQTDGIRVSYGTPQPYINSFGAIGGNVNYLPRMPGKKRKISTNFSYGSFDTRGYGASYNTGLTNLGNMYIRFESKQTANYLNETPNRLYSFYTSYDFPTITPLSKWSLVFAMNKVSGYIPARMPEKLMNSYGRYYQWPRNFTWSTGKSESIIAILQNKTLLSPSIVANFKGMYEYIHNDRIEYVNPNSSYTNKYYSQVETLLPVETVCQYSGNDFMGNNSEACQDQTISGDNYHNYKVGINTFALTSGIDYFNKYIDLKVGGMAFASIMSHSQDYVYGSLPIPTVPGYNDLWDEHAYRIYGKLYFQAKIKPIKNISITPGVKYESVTTHINDVPGYYYDVGASSGKTYGRFSPYIGVEYKPIKDFEVYGSDSIGYKYPNISAFYSADSNATATSPSSPITIKPERVDTYQFGFLYNNKKTKISLAFYDANFTNTFSSYVDPSTGITYEFNIGSSKYTGMNLAGSYAINRYFTLYANYSLQEAHYTNRVSSSYGETTFPGEPRPETPTYLAMLGVSAHYRKTDARLYTNLVGPQYIGSYTGAPTSRSLPSYSTLNLAISHKWNINSSLFKSLNLGLQLTNMLNSNAYILAKEWPYLNGSGTYIEASPLMPRAVFANVKVSF